MLVNGILWIFKTTSQIIIDTSQNNWDGKMVIDKRSKKNIIWKKYKRNKNTYTEKKQRSLFGKEAKKPIQKRSREIYTEKKPK